MQVNRACQVENLLVDGPEVSRANRQWRFPGTALVGGICVMAATWWIFSMTKHRKLRT